MKSLEALARHLEKSYEALLAEVPLTSTAQWAYPNITVHDASQVP